jgi:hypothetical protein
MNRYRFLILAFVVLAASSLVAAVVMTSQSLAAGITDTAMNPAQAPQEPTPFIITGYVYHPDGSFLSSGFVKIYDPLGNLVNSTIINPDGSYSIPTPAPGNYKVFAIPPSPLVYLIYSLPEYIEVTGPEYFNIDFHVRFKLVGGKVINRDTLAGIKDATVHLYDSAGSVDLWEDTNQGGEFVFSEGITVGQPYSIEVLPPYGTDFIPVTPTVSIVPTVTNLTLELFLPPINVGGFVQNPDGVTLPNARVQLWDSSWNYYETLTDINGQFSFRGIPGGDYTLQVRPPWVASGLRPSAPVLFSLTASIPNFNAGIITLPYGRKIVTGHVYEKNTSFPAENAFVWANRQDSAGYNEFEIDASGAYTLYLSIGEWNIGPAPVNWPAGWFYLDQPAWVKFTQPEMITETLVVDFEVRPADAAVTGQIVCPGLNPCIDTPSHTTLGFAVWNDQLGNFSGVNDTYQFTIPVLSGWYNPVLWVDDHNFQAPRIDPVLIKEGQVRNLGYLELQERNASIRGQVTNESGQGLQGISVLAWQPDNGVGSWGETNALGFYSLTVAGGEWFILPEPPENDPHLFEGVPTRVDIPSYQIVRGIDFSLRTTNARLSGSVVDASSGEPLTLDGWAWLNALEPTPFFNYGPLQGGNFSLKAAGGHLYEVGVDLPPDSNYLPGSISPVPVGANRDVTVTIPLVEKNAWVSGYILDGISELPIQDHIELYAVDSHGNWSIAEVDQHSGYYELGLRPGKWAISAWLDDSLEYAAPSPLEVVIIQANEQLTRNLELWPLDSTISGTVLSPAGVPLKDIYVGAWGGSHTTRFFETYVESDENGQFILPVPQGVYTIGAFLPGPILSALNWSNPAQIGGIDSSPAQPAENHILQFFQINGLVEGELSFAPGSIVTPTHEAYIWAWNENGGWQDAHAAFDNISEIAPFELPVNAGAGWRIGAVYEDWEHGVFYRAEAVPFTMPASGGTIQQNLILHGPYPLPQPLIITFDATMMQTIDMPNGMQLQIPPGALATSGQITLYIFPTYELAMSADSQIVDIGYDIWAVDQDGLEIKRFNQNIFVTIPYLSDDELAALGLSENGLIPLFYSTLLGKWLLVDGFVIDTLNNTIQFQLNHFSKFGTGFSPAQEATNPPEYKMFMPMIRH